MVFVFNFSNAIGQLLFGSSIFVACPQKKKKKKKEKRVRLYTCAGCGAVHFSGYPFHDLRLASVYVVCARVCVCFGVVPS